MKVRASRDYQQRQDGMRLVTRIISVSMPEQRGDHREIHHPDLPLQVPGSTAYLSSPEAPPSPCAPACWPQTKPPRRRTCRAPGTTSSGPPCLGDPLTPSGRGPWIGRTRGLPPQDPVSIPPGLTSPSIQIPMLQNLIYSRFVHYYRPCQPSRLGIQNPIWGISTKSSFISQYSASTIP